MTDQPMQFVAQAVVVICGLSMSGVERNDDVAEFHRFALDRGALQPVGCVVERRKGQHIGWA